MIPLLQLKFIKNCLRLSLGEEKLSAWHSVENEISCEVYFENIVDGFPFIKVTAHTFPSALGSNRTCHSGQGRERVGFLKANSYPEQNEMILKYSLSSLLSQSLLLSSKAEQGLPTGCAKCSSRDCEENGESRLDSSQSFSGESLSAAPNSWCCLPLCAISMATSEVTSHTPPLPPDSAPLSHVGRGKSKPYMEEMKMEIT